MEEYSSRARRVATTGAGTLKGCPAMSFQSQSLDEGSSRHNTKPTGSVRPTSGKAKQIDNCLDRPKSQSLNARSSSAFTSKSLVKAAAEKRKPYLSTEQLDAAESSNRQAYSAAKEKDLFYESQVDVETTSSASTDAYDDDDDDVELLELKGNSNLRYRFAKDNASSSNLTRQSGKDPSFGKATAGSVKKMSFDRSDIVSAIAAASGPSFGLRPETQKRGLKNLTCTSLPDVIPSGCSETQKKGLASDINGRRNGSLRIRASDRSSLLGTANSSTPSRLGNTSTAPSPVPERTVPPQSSNGKLSGSVSVRAREGSSRGNQMSVSVDRDDGRHVFNDSSGIRFPRVDEIRAPATDDLPARSEFPFAGFLPHEMLPPRRPSPSVQQEHQTRTASHSEGSSTHFSGGFRRDRDFNRDLNMERIADVLVVLERLGQDGVMPYEQLLLLETNLLLGGLSLSDEHSDMRMDIDNMSYEELLALEESIGTVSTALSEDQLAHCVRRSVFLPSPITPRISDRIDDHDIKCSICQEEYTLGDEIGRLGCEHQYHVSCIHQWLKMKNWCPVCKSPATPQLSSRRKAF